MVETFMMARGVPYEMDGTRMSGGMLWNVDDAIARLEGDDCEVSGGEMGVPELMALKKRLVERRTLMLTVFTGLAVEDTLPANFWPSDMDGEATELRQFAQEERGSMAKLNFLGGLGIASQRTKWKEVCSQGML